MFPSICRLVLTDILLQDNSLVPTWTSMIEVCIDTQTPRPVHSTLLIVGHLHPIPFSDRMYRHLHLVRDIYARTLILHLGGSRPALREGFPRKNH